MKYDFDNAKDELLSKIDRGLKYGTSKGAETLELYLSNSHSMNISIEAGIITAIQGGIIGVGCRCVAGGNKIGFASTSGISDERINFAIDSALSNARINQEDDRWQSFVYNKEVGKEGIIDTSVLEVSSEDIVKGAGLIFKEAKDYDPRVVSVFGSVFIGYGAFAVGNSEGITKASAATGASGSAYITAFDNGKTKTSFDFVIGRGIPDFEGIGKNGAAKAIKLLDSNPLNKTGKFSAVFDPLAAGQLIKTALSNSVNGKSVVEGRSAFADKIGEEVGVSHLTIYDDGQIPEDPFTHAIDGEGSPRGTTTIIDKGILKTFIFDQYYGKIFGTESTGNANREGPQSYESLPSVAPVTISVDTGPKNLDSLVSEVEEGVLITDFLMGMLHANLISGDFSVVSTSSYKIENGEIKSALEPITIAGNLYKAFNQIISIGSEDKLTVMGKVPSISFEGFTVSG
jgi:PmbA protein